MAEQPGSPRRKRRYGPWIIALVAVAVLAVGGFFVWRHLNTYESTDDAQVDGHIDAISARISGHVIEVLAEDEQLVKAGDVLVRIDPKDYEAAVAKAEADLANARATLEGLRADVPITTTNTASTLKSANSTRADAAAAVLGATRQLDAAKARLLSTQAQVREAEANVTKAQEDEDRYKLLAEKDEIPRQVYDTALTTLAAARATLEARRAGVVEAEQNIVAAEAGVEQAKQRITQAEASIEAAGTAPRQIAATEARVKAAAAQVDERMAALQQAQLNLGYCTIVSPATGIVGKKTVEVAENVSPGQQMMAVVPLEDVWITANFKETQLNRIRHGERVRFTVDAYDREYTGRVGEVGGASGSRFSLLPPENATGNYVKVVQRVPVRINLDPGQNQDHRLRVGMSVNPKVYVE